MSGTASVPTAAAFDALTARVAALEHPTPPVPGDQTGTQAMRIADLLEILGPNCFPNGQDGSGANASAAAHITGLGAICGGSGMGMSPRLYGGPDTAFILPICQALPGTIFNSAVSWDLNSSLANIIALVQNPALKGMIRAEGINEPNMGGVQMGGQPVPVATCLSIQQQLYAAAHAAGVTVLGPSVVDTGSNTYLTDYMGASLAAFVAAMDWVPGHDYPNSGNPGRDMARRTDYLAQTTGRPAAITEFGPLLYNNQGYDEQKAAYYSADAILIAPQHKAKLLQQWSMYDYNGFGMPVGLFKFHDPTQLTMTAQVMQSWFQLGKDTSGAARRTFTPGKLLVTVSPALPPNGKLVICQSLSSGQFQVFIGLEADQPFGLSTNYTLTFSGPRKRLREYWSTATPAQAMTVRQDKTNTTAITIGLANEDKLVVVDY